MTVLFLAHTRAPELPRRLLCHVGPGNKSVGQAEPGQIFTRLSPKKSRDCPVPGPVFAPIENICPRPGLEYPNSFPSVITYL